MKKSANADHRWREFGAGDESRTRDLNLGKVALYQLSYSRVTGGAKRSRTALNGFAIRCITALLSRQHQITENWSGRRVSNSRPQPWQGWGLPTELLPRQKLHYTEAFWTCQTSWGNYFEREMFIFVNTLLESQISPRICLLTSNSSVKNPMFFGGKSAPFLLSYKRGLFTFPNKDGIKSF